MNRLARKLKEWFTSRQGSRLVPAIPAILVCVVWIVFGFFLAGWGTTHTEAKYREIAGRAEARRDYETARVAYWRLYQLKNPTGETKKARFEYLFGVARCLGELNRRDEMAGLFGVLAPMDGVGYSKAHLFVAQSLLSATNLTPDHVRAAVVHLQHAIEAEPDNKDAQFVLGQIYLRQGQYELAKKHLTEAVSAKPEGFLLLAVAYRALGDEQGSRGYAERAVKYFSDKTREATSDAPGYRLAWANSLVMLKDYRGALTVLETGLNQSGNQAYFNAIGSLYATWVQTVTKDNPGDFDTRLRLVQTGLRFAPKSEVLLKALVEITHSQGKEGAAAREAITKMLAEGGQDIAMLHFLLGIDCIQTGRKEEAEQHFKFAFENAPMMPTVANNMAMILAVGDNPDLPRALQIINEVLERNPRIPVFRSTRGYILAKLGQHEEAVKDLEAALPYLQSKRNTRLALAKSYRELGLTQLADEHERLAKTEPAITPVLPLDGAPGTNAPPPAATNAPPERRG